MWGWSTPVSAWLLHGTGDMRLLQWVPLPPKFHVLPHGILCRACPQRSYGSLIMHECAGKGGGNAPAHLGAPAGLPRSAAIFVPTQLPPQLWSGGGSGTDCLLPAVIFMLT